MGREETGDRSEDGRAGKVEVEQVDHIWKTLLLLTRARPWQDGPFS